MKLPFQIDLNDKVVVITGAGGLICSAFAEAMAMCGAKVALLDLNEEAAKKWLANGAQPTQTVEKILKTAGIEK